MKFSIKSAVAGASALAIAGTLLVSAGGVANAATISPFDPPNGANGATQGTITFYDAAGNTVTSGPVGTSPAWALADTDNGRPGDTLATMFGATPEKGVNPGNWNSTQLGASSSYPKTSAAPANLLNRTQALAKGAFGGWMDPDSGLPAFFPNVNTDPAWQNLYQLRIYTSGPGQALDSSRYSSATVQITGNTWQQVYPEVVAGATTTVLTSNPASPQDAGTPLTLTANVTSGAGSPTGSVQFFDGATSLGSANLSGGSASISNVTLGVGSRSLKAVYTSNAPSQFAGSEGTLTFQSNQTAAASTATTLSVNPISGPAYENVTLSATVSRSSNGNALGAGTGSVKFFDGALQIGQGQMTASGVSIQINTLAPGAHSLTAQFTPADALIYNGSTSDAVSANYDAPACTACVDPQTVKVTVPAGGLSITTPYTPNNPFDLGTMALDNSGTQLRASANFPAAGDKLTITDTRAGDLPWTAKVTTSDFTGAGTATIDGAGLAFTSVTPTYISGNALNAATKPVVTTDVPSVKGGPHTFASAVKGVGSVYIDGALALVAPTSTTAGDYTATVTFTVG